MSQDEENAEPEFAGESSCESYHWSHAVHSYVGNKLHLILVKFVSTGIKFKDSIVKNIEDAGISDYSTFELYASHDLLIRAWADQDSYQELINNIEKNRDVVWKETALLEAIRIHHFPDGESPRSENELRGLAENLDAEQIEKIQSGADAEDEQRLIVGGIRIPDSVRFDKDRIQFYIIISAFRHDWELFQRFEESVGGFRNICNKTIYYAKGDASRTVIKGQVHRDRFYEINEFVNAVAVAVAINREHIRTETALVAYEGPHGNTRIDTGAARTYLNDKAFNKLTGGGRNLRELKNILRAHFDRAMSVKADDRNGVLLEMIRLRAAGQDTNFDHVRRFFVDFEQSLHEQLRPVMNSIFGSGDDEARRALWLRVRGVETGKKHLLLSDLTKIYCNLVDDHDIIAIDPLPGKEFRILMGEAVEIRNKIMHTSPPPELWERAFRFFLSFVTIDYRFHHYFKRLQASDTSTFGHQDELPDAP